MCAERTISLRELSRSDGEQSPRMYISYGGVVYDVTDCPKWRTGLHEGLHFPGQELTQELRENAPHSEDVFDLPCVKRVGRLETV
jgi:predicted heme/steroid binding protein